MALLHSPSYGKHSKVGLKRFKRSMVYSIIYTLQLLIDLVSMELELCILTYYVVSMVHE